jgi:hypothetical protein
MTARAAHPRPPGAPEVLDRLALTVARPMVLLRLGYRRASQVPPRTSQLLDTISAEGGKTLAPRAVCARCPVAATQDGRIVIGELLSTSSRSLAGGLKRCSEAWLFAATLGPSVDAWIESLSARDEMARTLLADAWASAAAIQLGLDMEALLGRRLRRPIGPGPLCPDTAIGSCPPSSRFWGTSGRPIGITLSEDGMMAPLKSVSAWSEAPGRS